MPAPTYSSRFAAGPLRYLTSFGKLDPLASFTKMFRHLVEPEFSTPVDVETMHSIDMNTLTVRLSTIIEVPNQHGQSPQKLEVIRNFGGLAFEDFEDIKSSHERIARAMADEMHAEINRLTSPPDDIAALVSLAGYRCRWDNRNVCWIIDDVVHDDRFGFVVMAPSATFEQWQRVIANMLEAARLRAAYPDLVIDFSTDLPGLLPPSQRRGPTLK